MTSLAALTADGTQLILGPTDHGLPQILHWGADLGPLADQAVLEPLWQHAKSPSSLDDPAQLRLLPAESDGWSGTPGFAGHRSGGDSQPQWRLDGDPSVTATPGEGGRIRLSASDARAGLHLRADLVMDRRGVLTVSLAVRNDSAQTSVYDVAALRALLPIPERATEILDLTGRWCRERSPERRILGHGTHERTSRRGRTGHDATLVLVAGVPGFTTASGEVWGVHVAWSGDHEHLAERLPEGAGLHGGLLGGGEALRPGEMRLAPGEEYAAPAVLFHWSDAGLDGLAARLHAHLRDRAGHPHSPRPLTLNSWEAVYFDHDLDRLRELAGAAAEVGVERFVLDDGWFRGRRSDDAGLGDWYVDDSVWPHGLHPLVDHVRSLGMQFGLWVEPEMVNPDSDLAREHPDWLLTVSAEATAPLWRQQQVLDVAHPDAAAYLEERLSALVEEYRIDFLKWDHNRDLHVALHARDGVRIPGVHWQTRAVYALLDRLRARFPELEIESCASGGARVDLGILQRTDRIWASDTNDAIERQSIQWWTAQLIPPELVGSHVGPPLSHTTGRVVDLEFRLATALFAHAGIEWDITGCTAQERAQIRSWAALYKEWRALLHGGRMVRSPWSDGGDLLHGIVTPERDHAAYLYGRPATAPSARPGRVPVPGLDPEATYRIRRRTEVAGSTDPGHRRAPLPGWCEGDGIVVDGRVLTRSGLALPLLHPGECVVFEAIRTT